MDKITLIKEKQRKGNKESVYLVKLNGNVIGLVTKYPDGPWQAHGLVPKSSPITTVNPFLGSFYTHVGAKNEAIQAVVKHHRGT